MKQLDLGPDALGELADAIDRSLAADRMPAWPPAFAAADGKAQKMEAGLTPETVAEAERELAAVEPAGDGAARAPGFLALVKDWLGRA